jgi:hypothetical protein
MKATRIIGELLRKAFACIWHHRLKGRWGDRTATVVGVKGWRTALVDDPGNGRQTETYLFKWEK